MRYAQKIYLEDQEKLKTFVDLKDPNFAYIFGLFQSDGHLSENTRNRGCFSLEINYRDHEIIYAISKLIPVKNDIGERKRSTNFTTGIQNHYICLSFHGRAFREKLIELGIPTGKKSLIVAPPKTEYSEKDYWRGFIDGDGSLGITKNGTPFISLCTMSEDIKEGFLKLIKNITGKEKIVYRNKRDNVYNIVVLDETAQLLTKYLYENVILVIPRKMEKAKEIFNWKRPEGYRPRGCEIKKWDEEQDQYILNHTMEQSCKKLKRTEKSVKVRLWRLKSKTQPPEQDSNLQPTD